MLLGRYIKWLAAFFTPLLVSKQIPLINTIDAAPSEASQLLSTVSEFANEVKVNIVEMITRPSDLFHENDHNHSQPAPAPALPPLPAEPSLELPPEPLQSPEILPSTNSTSRFLRMEGSKLILELDTGCIPGFGMLRKTVGWVAYWFCVLSPSASGVGSAGHSYWVYFITPAAIGFFGGLGYGFGGWCRWFLSRRKPPKMVEEVKPDVVVKETKPKAPADAYFETRLSQSYMLPFLYAPDPRRSRVPAPIVATKPAHAEETDSTIGRIVKQEEDADPLVVSPSLPDSFWYNPGSPISPTPLNNNGLDLPSYDGFKPKPSATHSNDLPETLMGSFPPANSPPRPPQPSLPDPWSSNTSDDRTKLV